MKEYTKNFLIKNIGLFIIVVIVGLLIIRVINSGVAATPETEVLANVSTLSLEDYKKEGATVSAIGEVEALSQVELKSQVAEQVANVAVKLGSRVGTGQILLTLENAELAAQLTQAQGSVLAEQARLDELKKGARPQELQIAQNNLASATQALQDALTAFQNAKIKSEVDKTNLKQSAVNSVNSTLTTAEDAVYKLTDSMFSAPESNPTLTFQVDNFQAKVDVEFMRELVGDRLQDFSQEIQHFSPQSQHIEQVLASAKRHGETIRSYLNRLSDAVNASVGLSSETLNLYRGNVNLARANINASITSLAQIEQSLASQEVLSKSALDSAQAGVNSAQHAVQLREQELELRRAGATAEQIAAQEARLLSARATLQGISARLAKTIIRSPIEGTVAEIPVRVGDLVNPGQKLVSVVNTGGLQITTFIPSEDIYLVERGASVRIEGESTGTVTQIAPSISAQTNKVEVVIALNQNLSNLIVGQFANLQIQASTRGLEEQGTVLPLEVIKTTPQGSFVFTVEEDNTLKAHQVTLGRTINTSIEVVGGLEGLTEIVVSTRGLEEGQQVNKRQ